MFIFYPVRPLCKSWQAELNDVITYRASHVKKLQYQGFEYSYNTNLTSTVNISKTVHFLKIT